MPLALDRLVKVASLCDGGIVSSTAAKDLLEDLMIKDIDPEKLAKDRGLMQVSDEGELVLLSNKCYPKTPKLLRMLETANLKLSVFWWAKL